MRFIKRLALNKKDPQSNRFAVEADDRIVTTSKVSQQLPSGTTSDRPANYVDGMIRYNTTIDEFEVYNSSGFGTGWETVRTIRQANITAQNLGYGNYYNTIFGPLSYDVSISKPQNIMVYVDNVYQIPVTNYTLINGAISTTATNVGTAPSGTTTIYVSTITNVEVGQVITAASGLAVNTTVTDVSTNSNSITINPPTTGIINNGDVYTFTFPTGTYIEFTGPVPSKPVVALLGFDGYYPPFNT